MINILLLILSILLLTYSIRHYMLLDRVPYRCRQKAIRLTAIIMVWSLSYSFLEFRWVAESFNLKIPQVDDLAWSINEFMSMMIFFLVIKYQKGIRKK